MSHPPITPSPRPLALSSVVPLPFKPPQPPLIIDPSGFNALVKEHQHHQLQQQQQRVMTLSQQPNNPLPVRPLPYPSPSTDLPPPSTSSTPSTTPSLALSTGPLSLHWQGPPRPDFPSASPFQPLFPFGRQPTVQFTAQGSASMGGVSFSASSPAPHQLPPPPSAGTSGSSSSASSSTSADPSPAEAAGFTPLQSGASALLFPQSPPSTAIQSYATSYGHQQPPSPIVPSAFDRSTSTLSSPFPSHAAHTSYYSTPELSAYQQQHAAYLQQMMKGMVGVQGGDGGVMGVDTVGVKRKEMHAGYMGPTSVPSAGAAAAAAAGGGGRHSACQVCHSAKTSCNGHRPCDRCIRLDRQSLCVDRPRKQPIRTDKKKAGKEIKKVKRESGEGEGAEREAHGSARLKEEKEGGHSAERNGAPPLIKVEGSQFSPSTSSAPSTSHTAPSASVPSVLLHDPGTIPRTSSSHSNHSASTADSSTSSSASSVATGSEDVVDVNTAAADELDRRLSSTYLRMHQTQATRAAIAQGISQGLATPTQVHFLLSYLAAVLHPDDFLQLLHPTPSASITSSSSTSPEPNGSLCMPGDVLTDKGVYVPRYVFNFAKSPLEPIDDSAMLGMDFATLQIIRGEPSAALNWDDDIADNNTADSDKGKPTSETAGGSGARSPSGPPTPSAPFASSSSAFSAFSPTSHSSTSPSTSTSSTPSGHPSARTSLPSPSTSSSAASSPSTASSSGSPPEQIFLIIRVNREFERLFGYSQATMRDLFRTEGSKVIYRLLVPQSLPQLSKWLTEAMLGGRTEYRALVTIINKCTTQHPSSHHPCATGSHTVADAHSLCRCPPVCVQVQRPDGLHSFEQVDAGHGRHLQAGHLCLHADAKQG